MEAGSSEPVGEKGRQRRTRPGSPWRRLERRLREKRYELVLGTAIAVTVGGALLIFMMIRPA